MAIHTPGPWKVVNGGRRVDGPFATAFGEGSQPIADVRVPSDSKNERLANARLIATAPDLLRLLEQLVEGAPADDGIFDCCGTIDGVAFPKHRESCRFREAEDLLVEVRGRA